MVSELLLFYTNLASLTAKFDLFLLEINNYKPAFILVTETHLHSLIPNSIINIPGYILYRLDRDNKRCGGVAIYVANQLNGWTIISKVNTKYQNNTVEALWLDIQYRELSFLMACVYRPPSSSFSHSDETLFNTIEKAASENTVIIAGDFNLPKIKWPIQISHGYDNLCENFVNMYTNTNLNQLITQITRKRNQEESLLDLIFCNDDSLICDIEYHPPIGKSDHLVITATVQALGIHTKSHKNLSTQYDFFKADYEKLSLHLANNLNIAKESIDDMWFAFKNQILDSIDNHIPKKKVCNKRCSNKPWINKEILKLTKRKKELWKNYRINPNQQSYKEYRNANNKIISISRSSRAAFESTIIDSGPKAF